jgi:hypothetical protein
MKSQEKLPHCSSSNGYESTEDKIYWRLAGYLVMERDTSHKTREVSLFVDPKSGCQTIILWASLS